MVLQQMDDCGFEQPQIYVTKRERQGHTQPLDSGRHLHDFTGIGSLGEFVVYFRFRFAVEHAPILRGFPCDLHVIGKSVRNIAANLFGRFFLDRPVATDVHNEQDDLACFIQILGAKPGKYLFH